jgi:hypothetical protein
VDGILEHLEEGGGGRHVVAETRDGDGLGTAAILETLPAAQETDDEVTVELAVQELGDDEQVGNQGALENDGDVGGVEELDWVRAGLRADLGVLDWQVHTEALRVPTKTNAHRMRLSEEDIDIGQRVTNSIAASSKVRKLPGRR